MKEKILKCKDMDDIRYYERKYIKKYRDEFYHKILADEETKKHLLKILNVDEDIIKNVLMIDGYPPIDDFDEEER